MTLCPVALAVGCSKCPIVKTCPLKSTIGNYKEPETSRVAQNDNSKEQQQEND